MYSISANYVDIFREQIYAARIAVEEGKIATIDKKSDQIDSTLSFILPGFVDAHVHVESSMLIPSEFARLAGVHGTVATVSDPHEIANVMGVAGVEFMLENAEKVPFKIFFGAPSCVPATPFETAGAELTAKEVSQLLRRPDIYYLAEVMNFPGVISGDAKMREEIESALKIGKPIDGHAPGLRGENTVKYTEAGHPGEVIISTDHECFSREEALEKLDAGMKILIREGSAARNFDALIDLLKDFPERMMFCSDDKHPDSLVKGHINLLVKRALKAGVPLFHALKAACINPVLHYKIPVGLLREGDFADFIVVSDLQNFEALATYVNGQKIAEKGQTLIPSVSQEPVNRFRPSIKTAKDFSVRAQSGPKKVCLIEAIDRELITHHLTAELPVVGNEIQADVERDILKMTVVNRYENKPPSVAFIKNFGIKKGAIASSVAHDSHNILAVGVDDESICRAVNLIMEHQGGVCAVNGEEERLLPLPVAGLMSNADGYEVARQYTALGKMVKAMGSTLEAPFMTLSFMALLVIPELKLSDRGLFDGKTFAFTNLILD